MFACSVRVSSLLMASLSSCGRWPGRPAWPWARTYPAAGSGPPPEPVSATMVVHPPPVMPQPDRGPRRGGWPAIDRWPSVPPWAGRLARRVDLSQIRGTESRLGAAVRSAPLDVPSPRWRDRVRWPTRRGERAGHSRGGVCGSTRPAPVRRSPYRDRAPQRRGSRPRQRGHHPGARPRRARGRGRRRSAGRSQPSVRTKFQVVALLVREERARVKADEDATEAQRAEQLKRLDGVATILAKTAARDTSLLALLAEDAVVSDAAKALQARDADAPPASRRRPRRSRRRAEPRRRRHRAPGRARSRSSPASSPTRSSPPTSPPPQPTQARPAPAGQLGAARPAVPLLRVRRRRRPSCMPLPEPSVAAGARRPAS